MQKETSALRAAQTPQNNTRESFEAPLLSPARHPATVGLGVLIPL